MPRSPRIDKTISSAALSLSLSSDRQRAHVTYTGTVLLATPPVNHSALHSHASCQSLSTTQPRLLSITQHYIATPPVNHSLLHSHASCQSLITTQPRLLSITQHYTATPPVNHSARHSSAFLPSGLLFVNYVHSLMSWASSCKPNLRMFEQILNSWDTNIIEYMAKKTNKTHLNCAHFRCAHFRLRGEAWLTSCAYAFKARVRSFTAWFSLLICIKNDHIIQNKGAENVYIHIILYC